LIVVLWRAGLRINEALSLTETDLEEQRKSTWEERSPAPGWDGRVGLVIAHSWLAERATLPVGPLFCVIAGPTAGHAWSASAARLQLHQLGVEAGVRRRFCPTSTSPCARWLSGKGCSRGSAARLISAPTAGR
jgi:hypothetical protein